MDRRRSDYTRRIEKSSQREKRLATLAVLGVAAGVAGVLAPPLNIDWPNLLRERDEITHVGAGSSMVLAPVAAPAPAAEQGAARRIYPFSIIPGGVADKDELASVIRADAVVAAHYAGFDVANARAVTVTAPRAVYVSYRKGDQVYWTKKKLMLAPGETLLTDGENEMRARCANRISDVPMFPIEANGPTETELDSFVVDGGGGLMAVAAAVDGLDDGPMGERFSTASFPNGAGLVVPAAAAPATRSPWAPAANTPSIPPIYGGGRIGDETSETGTAPPTTPPPTTTPPTTTPPTTTPPTTTPPTTTPPTTTPPTTTPPTTTPPTTTPPTTTPPTTTPPATTPPTTTPPTTTPPTTTPPTTTPPTDTPPDPPIVTDPPIDPPIDIPVDPEDPPVEVPEPGTLWLGGVAFAAMLWLRRKGARAKG